MKILKHIFLFTLVFIKFSSFSQSLSENDIKQLAQKINNEMRGTDMGNGLKVRGCFANGRTLIYQYDVDDNWYPPDNMKENLISNFKEAGYAEVFFNNDVNADFHYYSGNSLRKKISIKSGEFSGLNFGLGDFISIDGHPKAKGVNLKIKPPGYWEIKEGDRPNIVKKFLHQNNSYMIIIKDNYTFLSRNEAKQLLDDKVVINEFLTEATSFLKNPEILNQGIVSVDKYPALVFTFKGWMERSGINMELISKNWIIFYEDKVVFLQGTGLANAEFKKMESVYNLITNSVIFPEQYNY
jgi:hypothetical protein